MKPLVSILIPCFNAAPWLAATLDSAFGQTWENKEIVLVDDGSTDASLSIAQPYATRGLRIVVQSNQGAAAARNAALKASSGEWIQFLDADDLLARDKIARQMSVAAELGNDFLLAGKWSRFTSTPDDAIATPEPLCRDANPTEWVIAKYENNAMMHPAAWLMPRPLAERIGPWDTALSLDDDGEYFGRAVLASSGVRFCGEAQSFYRSRISTSLSNTKSDAAWASAFRSVESIASRLLTADSSVRARQACATAFQRFIYEAYPARPDLRTLASQKVASLGGTTLRFQAGSRFSVLAALLGWRLAKRLALALRRP